MDTRRGITRGLLFLLLLFVSCADHGRGPGAARIQVQVMFPGAERGSAAAVNRIEIAAYDAAGEDPELITRIDADITEDSTRFRAEVEIPPGPRTLLLVDAFGRRSGPGGASEDGLLFSGRDILLDLEAGEVARDTVRLAQVAPSLSLEVAPRTSYRLSWSEAPGAARYALRELTEGGDGRDFLLRGTDTTVVFPPARSVSGSGSGGGGVRLRYRVRAELDLGRASAFSESVGVTIPRSLAPSPVTLELDVVTDSALSVRWIAPGDDGNEGAATGYDLRIARFTLDESNFDSATPVPGLLAPSPAGTEEHAPVRSLIPETRYFLALRSVDDAGNLSPLSNVLDVTTLPAPDTTPPGRVTDLAAQANGETEIQLTWTATGDDGGKGSAARYEIRHASFPLDGSNFDAGTLFASPPAPSPAGSRESATLASLARETEVFFALRAIDELGNIGAVSNGAQATTPDLTAPGALDGFQVRAAGTDTLRLVWIEPGDDASDGTVASIELRMSTSPITPGTWDAGTVIPDLPSPRGSGSPARVTVRGLAPRTLYHFGGIATDNAGNHSALATTEGQTAIESPSDPRVESLDPHQAMVTWSFALPDPDEFVLYRREGAGDFSIIGSAAGGTRAFLDDGLSPATSYTWRVRARIGTEVSDPSAEVSATTPDLDPVCAVSPDSIDFGLVAVGNRANQSFFIENQGGGTLAGSITPDCGPFQVVEGQDYSIGRGDPPHKVTIRFEPTAVADYGCALDLPTPCASPVTLLGGGDGPAVCDLSPTKVEFDTVRVGDSARRTWVIRNLGGGALDATITPNQCGEISLDGPSQVSVGRLDSALVTVSFTPTIDGAQQCLLSLSAEGCPSLTASGYGELCRVTPDSLDFGVVGRQQTVYLQFTIQNLSRQTRDFTWTQDVAGPCDFFSSTSLPNQFTLAPEQGQIHYMSFSAGTPGTYRCLLWFYSSIPGAPLRGAPPSAVVPLRATVQ